MYRLLLALGLLIGVSCSAAARVEPFPAGFHAQLIPTNGTSLYVRVGGHGPAVVMLHGFGDTGDMWAPLARVLMQGPHRHRPRSARHGPLGAS